MHFKMTSMIAALGLAATLPQPAIAITTADFYHGTSSIYPLDNRSRLGVPVGGGVESIYDYRSTLHDPWLNGEQFYRGSAWTYAGPNFIKSLSDTRGYTTRWTASGFRFIHAVGTQLNYDVVARSDTLAEGTRITANAVVILGVPKVLAISPTPLGMPIPPRDVPQKMDMYPEIFFGAPGVSWCHSNLNPLCRLAITPGYSTFSVGNEQYLKWNVPIEFNIGEQRGFSQYLGLSSTLTNSAWLADASASLQIFANNSAYNFFTSDDPSIHFESSTGFNYAPRPIGAVVPEPTAWAMMIVGFGLVGGAMRRRVGVRRVMA
nr:PEPxxWA-CTERM sorting domain-containing protein [Sandaracinobacteroides saxicola]